MELLQYSFTLHPDHPMQAIRERVAQKRDLVCTLPGLGWKAWLISEPLPGRMQPKTYAPLYLFKDSPSMLGFLSGPVYKGVTDAFGWTRPHHGHAFNPHETQMAGARSCTLTVSDLGNHASLCRALQEASSVRKRWPGTGMPEDFLGAFQQVDIARMALRTFEFWTCEALALRQLPVDLVYEVVDVSLPLPGG